jgi:translation initiation factor 3 subunit C
MASRFFYGSGSDSDSSSDEEEEVYRSGSDSDEESSEESGEGSSSESDEEGEDHRTGASKFLHDDSESEESEEEEKVTIVKSAKDKRLEGIESTIRLIDNAQKINDWAVIATGESTCLGGLVHSERLRSDGMASTDMVFAQNSTT